MNRAIVGAGHQSNSPNLPVIRETELNPVLRAAVATGKMQPGTRRFRMGRVTIMVSPPYMDMGWHMSISAPDRYPTWDEVAKAWYELVPDADNRVGTMTLPKREDYISLHNFCFHVHEEVKGQD